MYSTVNPALCKPVSRWLIACLCMVALMVVVGGLTRLTESGLSMVEWKPATLLPPMNETEWQDEFLKYQQSPEFRKENHLMEVDDFKGIFWLEYIHRLLGRLVGMVFMLPYVYFLWRRAFTPAFSLKLLGIFALGGMQGVIGWYMVKSGLVDQPWVSPVRLAMHLGMAFIIFGLLLWQWLTLQHVTNKSTVKHILPIFCLGALYLQILLGALVAGMDAGLAFNTFPDMNGEYLPSGMGVISPWYLNLIENPTTAHAIHRYGALAVTILLSLLGYRLYKSGHIVPALMLASALFLQVLLGIFTVVYGVPILLASLHQVVALALFGTVILTIARTTYPPLADSPRACSQ